MAVLLDGVADVEGALGLDIAGLRTLAEGNTVHDAVALVVHELQFDMLLSAAHHLARAVVIDTLGAEDGARIAWAEGGKALELLVELEGDVLEVQHSVDFEGRLCLFVQDMLGHVGFEAAAELLDVLHAHGQASRVGMTAEVFQQVRATLHRLIDIEAVHRARATRGQPFAARQYDGGAVVLLGQARGHDADDALVPLFVVDNDGAAVVQLRQVTYLLDGFLGHGFVQVLARLVVEVDASRLLNGGRVVLLHQQVNRLAPVLHTARGVDAGANLEDDVVHREFALVEATHLDDSLQSDART